MLFTETIGEVHILKGLLLLGVPPQIHEGARKLVLSKDAQGFAFFGALKITRYLMLKIKKKCTSIDLY